MARALKALDEAEVVVFTKILADAGGTGFDSAIRLYGELIRRIGPRGPRVVMDVNDHHFEHPGFRSFYLGSKPHAWITSTQELARVMVENGLVPVSVIPDPYEGPQGSPAPPLPTRYPRLFRMLERWSSQGGRRWRASLLWFGHPANLSSLAACIDELAGAKCDFPLHLHCVCAPGYGLESAMQRLSAAINGSFSMSFEAWSSESTWAALRSSDMVVLPVDLASEKNRVKSANRLIETLRAGRFAVAHPMPAYLELREFAYVGESLADGIAWALANPMKALDKIERGQRYIEERFSPQAIARQWLNCLQSVRSGKTP
jgi:hypothetical protein